MQVNHSTSIPETIQRFDEGRVTINFDVVETRQSDGDNPPEYEYKSILAPIDESKMYETLLIALIREKYTSDDELSIQRKRESNPDEFRDYDLYVKLSKYKAKRILNGSLTLEDAKSEKIAKLDYFDCLESPEGVNWFYLNGVGMWLYKELRQSLDYTRNKKEKMELQTTTVWCGDTPITLPLETVDQMLTQLEIYADACYNVTAWHRAEINALTSVEEVDAYDFSTGYPEKINF